MARWKNTKEVSNNTNLCKSKVMWDAQNNISETKKLHCVSKWHLEISILLFLWTPISSKSWKVSRIIKYNLYLYEHGKNLCKNFRNQIARVSWTIFRLSFREKLEKICFAGTQLWSPYMYVNPILRFICGPTLVVIILCSISPYSCSIDLSYTSYLAHYLSHTLYLSHNLHALLLVYVSILSFSPLSISLHILFSHYSYLSAERIESKEDHVFLRSYDSAPRPPPLPSASWTSFSVFLCVSIPAYWLKRRGGEGVGVEPNHTTAITQ